MLLDIVRQIVTRYGEQILFDPKRINAFFLDLAKDEPKPRKRAFIECLEFGVVKVLKGVANSEERFDCRETLAQRLHDEEGLDVELYRKAIDILCEVLFGSVPLLKQSSALKPSLQTEVSPEHIEPISPRLVGDAAGSAKVYSKIFAFETEETEEIRRWLHNRHIKLVFLIIVGVLLALASVVVRCFSPFFTDPRDGNVYRTVKIGNQVWMAKNLNYEINGSWCYNNDEANGKKYGRLYAWDAAKVACPAGWHLPTRREWDELVEAAGGERIAGEKLKATIGWYNNGNGTNDYGFSALPGGFRLTVGGFNHADNYGLWWTATENGSDDAYYRGMGYDGGGHVGEGSFYKSNGSSVRCVKD